MNLSGYEIVFKARAPYSNTNCGFSTKVGDIIKATPDCGNDMRGMTVKVIEIFKHSDYVSYRATIVSNDRNDIGRGRLIGEDWNMTYMSGRIHTGCDVYRKISKKPDNVSWEEFINGDSNEKN